MKPPQNSHFVSKEEKTFWIESIMNDFEEGSAEAEDIINLRALLLKDSEARQIYLESNRLTNLLESASSITAKPKKGASLLVKRWAAGLGVAAAIALGIGVWSMSQPLGDSPVSFDQATWLASLSSSNDPNWEGQGDLAGKFYSGKLKLISGVAELEFQNGAQFIIEGPCALGIINASKIELEYGKIWGHCPPTAHGFEVLAPGGNRIVDLGTEFGVGVASSGEVEVHVFDGEVEFFSKDLQKQALDAGSALKIAPGGKPYTLNASEEGFTNTFKLQSDLYQMHRSSVLEREDLVLYYDFSGLSMSPLNLKDSGPRKIDAAVVGALPVKGRMADKEALLFEKETDGVALDLESLDLGNEFTLAMWVKPTDLARSHMALLNSNGFNPGNIHFQIHDDGRLVSAIAGMGRCASPRDSIKTNTWQLVAMSWNFETSESRLFLNGVPLDARKTDFRANSTKKPFNFGRCQIGSWAEPSYGHRRSFEGRIDEVMLFSSELSESEMAELYERSRP